MYFAEHIVTGGGIRLRYDPKVQEEVGPGVKDGKSRKTKLCWMEANHPDGCPYPPISCRFAHRDEQFGALWELVLTMDVVWYKFSM